MSRLRRLLPTVTALLALASHASAQDTTFEDLQRQMQLQQQQLQEQGQLPDQGLPPDQGIDGQEIGPDAVPAPDPEAAPDPGPDAGPGPDVDDFPMQTKAQRVKNPVAVFSGLDKITGRITSFDVYVDETVQFGALQVTPKVCYSSGQGEAARTDAFVKVDEITLQRDIRQIFSGWMFADSPGLNAVEHPVYDVWLKSCKTESAVPAPAG